jgi:hypothetical protein
MGDQIPNLKGWIIVLSQPSLLYNGNATPLGFSISKKTMNLVKIMKFEFVLHL